MINCCWQTIAEYACSKLYEICSHVYIYIYMLFNEKTKSKQHCNKTFGYCLCQFMSIHVNIYIYIYIYIYYIIYILIMYYNYNHVANLLVEKNSDLNTLANLSSLWDLFCSITICQLFCYRCSSLCECFWY